MANTTIPLSFCTYNMHGFKTGFNTLNELCNPYDLIAVQEHWLRKDNMSNLALVNSKYAHYGVSGMVEAASSGLLRGRPFGGVAFLWNPAAVKKVSVVGAGPAGRCAAIKLVVDKYVILAINVYLPCYEDSLEYSHNLHIYFIFILFEIHPDMHLTESLFKKSIDICSRKRLKGLSLVLAGFSSF